MPVTFCAYDRPGACGGPYGWAADFAEFLHESGFSPHVLIICPGGQASSAIFESCRSAGIVARVFDSAGASTIEDQTEWLLGEWKRRPSEVFISNLVLPAMFASRWIREAGARTVAVVHSDPGHDDYYRDVVSHFISGPPEWRFDTAVGVSNFISGNLRTAASYPLDVHTIACGTRLPSEVVTAPRRGLRLLYAGRLIQVAKRVRELTDAFLDATSLPGVTASICGDGPERMWVEQRIEGNLRVEYLGSLPPDEMPGVMASHHVITLLSDYEGLPMSLVEGMACGLVPVCLDEPSGAREIIQHDVNGLIVTDRGSSFIEAVEKLLDETEWARLSGAARETAISKYSHPVVFGLWAELLRGAEADRPLELARLPARVDLSRARNAESFAGYPRSRGSLARRASNRIARTLEAISVAARPRARLRELSSRLMSRK